MQLLNRTLANKPKALPLKIMQFGGGNFLRAFVDWMVQLLNEQADFNAGIAIIKPTERGNYKQQKVQDGLFTVVLDGIKEGESIAQKKLITCVQEIINPYAEWPRYLDLAKSEDIRFIVSNTTESGIRFNAEDNYSDEPPREFPAKLTVWLHHRYLHFKDNPSKGCIVLPCELIEHNGTALKNTILEYAHHWQLEDEFKKWVVDSNHFCNTLVDRIVSGYPTERAEKIQNEIGFQDELLVAGEYYHSWVIEAPDLVKSELPFAKTDLNVAFANDLAPYREMKVRVLNGAHTAMVPLGYLSGLRLVKEVMDDSEISEFIASMLYTEILKTLDFDEAEKTKYAEDVLNRFRNPLLKHRLIDIALNSTSKFKTRLLPTLEDYLELTGKLPKHIVFAFSSMLLFYKGKYNGEKIDLKDNKEVLDFFDTKWNELAHKKTSLSAMVVAILENDNIWGENLNLIQGLADQVTLFIQDIQEKGIRASLKSI